MIVESRKSEGSQSTAPHRHRESRWVTLAHMEKRNPLRLPAWRVEWALRFAHSRQPLPARGLDPLLAIAAQMHVTLRDDKRPISWSRLGLVYDYLQAAQDVYDRDGLQCAEIEARILAGQSDDEIAELLGLKPKAIELYGAIFFDVRDRLKAPDWISTYAVDRAGFMSMGFTETDNVWRAWRAFGYRGGVQVLSAVIKAVRSPEDLTTGLAQCDLQNPEGRLTARARLAVAAMVVEMTPQVVGELLRIRELIGEIEAEQRASAAGNVVETLLDQALEAQSAANAEATPAVVEPVATPAPAAACETSDDAADAAEQEAA